LEISGPDFYRPNALPITQTNSLNAQKEVKAMTQTRKIIPSFFSANTICSGCTDPERWWAGRRVFFLGAKLPF